MQINLDHTHAFYTVTKDGILLHAGVCRLRDVIAMPDARRNPTFAAFAEGVVTLEIRGTYHDKLGAMIERREWLKLNPKPLMQSIGHRATGARTLITCNEDGQTFPSMTAAARHYGISHSSISNHIAGRAGYEAPAGHTFRRGK